MIELTKGQELDLLDADGQPLTGIKMGIGWDKERTAGFIATGRAEVDLDASAMEFSGGELFDLAVFNNLSTRDGSVVHLGDNRTGDGKGDDETITVDLARVHPVIDTVVFVVTSYQGHTLEWVDRAYCRLLAEDDVELARLTLTQGVRNTGVVMAKIFRVGDQWRLLAIGEGIAAKSPSEAAENLRPFV